MNVTVIVCIRVLNQTACVAERVHAYERVIFVRVTSVSDACHTHLACMLLVCTVHIRSYTVEIHNYVVIY